MYIYKYDWRVTIDDHGSWVFAAGVLCKLCDVKGLGLLRCFSMFWSDRESESVWDVVLKPTILSFLSMLLAYVERFRNDNSSLRRTASRCLSCSKPIAHLNGYGGCQSVELRPLTLLR